MADDTGDPEIRAQLSLSIAQFEKATARAQAAANKSMAKLEQRTAQAGKTMEKAMSESADRVNLSLGKINFARLGTQLREFAGERAEGAVEGLSEQFMELGKNILLPIAAIATVEGAIEAFKTQIERADSFNKLAQQVGASVESLTQLDHAAKLADVSTEQLTTGLRQLASNALKDTQGETGGATLAFRALGISVTDAAGKVKPTNELFIEVADKFAHMQDGATKTGLAMQIFGKAGAQLIPVLNEGHAGLKDLADESDRLGLTISSKSAAAAEEFNDQLTRLGERFEGIISTVTQDALPGFLQLADQLTDLANNSDFVNSAVGLLEGGVRDLTSMIVQMNGGAQQAVDIFTGLQMAFEDLSRGGDPGGFFKIMDVYLQQFVADGEKASQLAKDILAGKTTLDGEPTDKPEGGTGGTFTPTIVNTGAEQQQKRVDQVTAALKRQIDALRQTSREQAIANAQAQAHVAATSKDGQAIGQLAGTLYDQRTALEASNDAAKSLAGTFATAFDSMLTGSKSFNSALGDIAKSLAEMALQATLLGSGPLAGLFGTAPANSNSAGGILGSIASALVPHLADGGQVRGPGTSRSDSVPAMLSAGEFVVNAVATGKNLALLHAINSGSIARFADGGLVAAPKLGTASPSGITAPMITVAPSITINANGGTAEQNADLAGRVGKHVENAMRGIVADELVKQLRPGNLLYKGGYAR